MAIRPIPLVIVVLLMAGATSGAEIQLRPECKPLGPVVLLGDVAEIFASQPDQVAELAAIELFPAPPAGVKRFVGLREIQDALVLRGVGLADQLFSGSSRVLISTGVETAAAVPPERAASSAECRLAARTLREAVLKRLAEEAAPGEPWEVEVSLDEAQARQVLAAGGALSIEGLAAPWLGEQRLVARLAASEAGAAIPFTARIALPPRVVVAVRSLARGAVIHPSDVQLQRGLPLREGADALQSLEEVVGRETTQPIPAGRVLDRSLVRSPLLVRQGEIVAAYSRRPGLQIRTTARARQNGSLGELVAVESLPEKTLYYARVTGAQEVEVPAAVPESQQP